MLQAKSLFTGRCSPGRDAARVIAGRRGVADARQLMPQSSAEAGVQLAAVLRRRFGQLQDVNIRCSNCCAEPAVYALDGQSMKTRAESESPYNDNTKAEHFRVQGLGSNLRQGHDPG